MIQIYKKIVKFLAVIHILFAVGALSYIGYTSYTDKVPNDFKQILDETDLSHVSVYPAINKIVADSLYHEYKGIENTYQSPVLIEQINGSESYRLKTYDAEFYKGINNIVVNTELKLYGESKTAELIRDKDIILAEHNKVDRIITMAAKILLYIDITFLINIALYIVIF